MRQSRNPALQHQDPTLALMGKAPFTTDGWSPGAGSVRRWISPNLYQQNKAIGIAGGGPAGSVQGSLAPQHEPAPFSQPSQRPGLGLATPTQGTAAMPAYNPYAPPTKRPKLGLAGGPVTASNPQNAGLAAGVNTLAGQNAAVAQRAPGPSYGQQVQSGALPMSDPASANRFQAANQRIYAANAPLGLAPSAEAGIQRQVGINQQGSQRESMLADMNGRGRRGPQTYSTVAGDGMVHHDLRLQPAPNTTANGPTAGSLFGGAIPGQVAYGSAGIGPGVQGTGMAGSRPGWMAPPAQPTAGLMNNDRMAAFAKSTGNSFNPETGQMGSTSVLGMSPTEAKVAGILGRAPGMSMTPAQAAAGRSNALGLANARQDSRKQATLARVGIRANNKQTQFNNQMELGLARANPAAYSQFKQAQGQLGLAQSNVQATNAYRKDQLAAQERMATANNASREKVAGLGLAKAGVDANGQPLVRNPVPPVPGLPPDTPQATHQAIREHAAAGDTEAIREELVRQGITDRGQQNDHIAAVTGAAPQSNPLFPFVREPSAGKPTPKQPIPKPRGLRESLRGLVPFA